METYLYAITVAGALGPAARDAFEGLEIEPGNGSTTMSGKLDQSALYGVLHRVESLGLQLVAIHRDEDGNAALSDHDHTA